MAEFMGGETEADEGEALAGLFSTVVRVDSEVRRMTQPPWPLIAELLLNFCGMRRPGPSDVRLANQLPSGASRTVSGAL